MTSARSLSSHTYNEGPEESERLYSDVTWPHIRLRRRHEHTHTHIEDKLLAGKKENKFWVMSSPGGFLDETLCPRCPLTKVLSWFPPGCLPCRCCLEKKTFLFLNSERSRWMDGDFTLRKKNATEAETEREMATHTEWISQIKSQPSQLKLADLNDRLTLSPRIKKVDHLL